jgi:hypothetical protein
MASQLLAAAVLMDDPSFLKVVRAAASYVALNVLQEPETTPNAMIRKSLANMILFDETPQKSRQLNVLGWTITNNSTVRGKLVSATYTVTIGNVVDSDIIPLVEGAWDKLAGAANAAAPET